MKANHFFGCLCALGIGLAITPAFAGPSKPSNMVKVPVNHKSGGASYASLKESAIDKQAAQAQRDGRAAANAKWVQQLRALEEAKSNAGAAAGPVDRAAGTALAGHGIDTSRSPSDTPRPGDGARDCIANPANCLSMPEHHGPSSPQWSSPVGPLTKGDRRAASDDPEIIHSEDDAGNKVTTTITHDGGTTTTHSVTRDPETREVIGETHVTTRSDGTMTVKGAESNGAVVGFTSLSFANGRPDPKHPPQTRVIRVPAQGPSSQPREDGSGRPEHGGNCGWNFLPCAKPVSHKDMTRSPVRGDDGASSSGTGSRAAGPRLGAEAVTNSGDSTFAITRGGRSGGRPYDPRDPFGHADGGLPKPPAK